MNNLNLNLPLYTKLYLFGSAVYSSEFEDIDLALIYEKNKIDIVQLLEIRNKLKKLIKNEFNCTSSILILSNIEEDELHFLENAKNIRIE